MLVLFALRAEVVYSSLSMVLFFGGVPTVVILVWALVIGSPAFKEVEVSPATQGVEVPTPAKEVEAPPPTGQPRKPRISRRTLHDIAYISYIILGLIAIWTSYWAYVDPDPGVIGFLVIIPFGIPLLLALILGPGISLFLWRDSRLTGLTALSIGVVIGVLTLREETWIAFLLPYGGLCMAIGLIWFTKYRKHFR
jgi:hypothetical protein